jgi:hypothetical protein
LIDGKARGSELRVGVYSLDIGIWSSQLAARTERTRCAGHDTKFERWGKTGLV